MHMPIFHINADAANQAGLRSKISNRSGCIFLKNKSTLIEPIILRHARLRTEAMNALSSYTDAAVSVRDIAIVGYSFKLPQDVNDDQSFWEALESRRNLRTDWPASRVDSASFVNNKLRKVHWQFILSRYDR